MTEKKLKIILNLIMEQDAMTRRLDIALGELNSSYTVLELDVYTRKVIWILLEEFFDPDEISLIGWWLYEPVDKVIWEGKKKHKVKKINAFIKYIMSAQQKKVSRMLELKQWIWNRLRELYDLVIWQVRVNHGAPVVELRHEYETLKKVMLKIWNLEG